MNSLKIVTLANGHEVYEGVLKSVITAAHNRLQAFEFDSEISYIEDENKEYDAFLRVDTDFDLTKEVGEALALCGLKFKLEGFRLYLKLR